MEGELERLVAAEARISTRLAQAGADAQALIAAARARVEQAEHRWREELEEATSSLQREMEQDRTHQLRCVTEELQVQLAALQAITEERITELALHAVNRLLQPSPARRQ
jgi:phenylalanyl-tRNA synthetase alpha subunit